MTRVAERSAQAASLIRSFGVTDRVLQERLYSIAKETSARQRKRLLRDLQAEYGQHAAALRALSEEWASTGLSDVFDAGRRAFYRLSRSAEPAAPPEWADLDALKRDASSGLSDAIDHAQRDISRMVRADSSSLNRLLFGRPDAGDISDALVRQLSRLAVSGVIYSNGARHTLGDYGSMLITTLMNKTYNMGTINAATAAGTDFLVISDGPNCGLDSHGSFPTADGMVVTIDEARANPLAHPRCVRTFFPWHGDPPDQAPSEDSPEFIPPSFGFQRHLARLAVLPRRSARS